LEGAFMHSRNDFYVGFIRGLNSVAEVFAPYRGAYEGSPGERLRSDWADGREDMKNALGVSFAKIAPGSSKRQLAQAHRLRRPVTRFVSAHWRGPLPPPTELEKIEQTIPGGADRLLRIAEQDLELALRIAEQDLQMTEKDLQITEKEQAHRFEDSRRRYEDSRRGQWLGWSLAAGALTAATVVSLFHASWQASVALVGIPMLGAVQALIQGRKESDARHLASAAGATVGSGRKRG
jgi:uncharacterized membrane protein